MWDTKRVLGGEGEVSGSRREAVSSFPPPFSIRRGTDGGRMQVAWGRLGGRWWPWRPGQQQLTGASWGWWRLPKARLTESCCQQPFALCLPTLCMNSQCPLPVPGCGSDLLHHHCGMSSVAPMWPNPLAMFEPCVTFCQPCHPFSSSFPLWHL